MALARWRTEEPLPRRAGPKARAPCFLATSRLARTVHSACRPRRVKAWDRFRAGTQGLWPFGRPPIRPVLKHGPRSLTCARVTGLYETRRRNESEGCPLGRPRWDARLRWRAAPLARLVFVVSEAEQERTRWDPKDGELCLSRMKSEETLMEVRSDSDVQIDRRTWV